jgi:hypothetical protein
MTMEKIFILFIAVILTGAAHAGDDLAPLGQIKFEELKATKEFNFIKKGDLFYINMDSAHQHFSAIAFYVNRKDGCLIPLTNSLSNISQVILAEVDSSSEESFIRCQLAWFLVSTQIRPGIDILSANYINGYAGSFAVGANSISLSVPTHMVTELRKFCTGVTAKIGKDSWKIEFNVMTESGGIERWLAAGDVAPFAIKEFTIRILAPQGTFKPEPTTG